MLKIQRFKKSIPVLTSFLCISLLWALSACTLIDNKLKDTQILDRILSAQNEEVQARYPYRKPAEILRFFEVKPATKVLEVMPGGGWYSNILRPYLGEGGELISADYTMALYDYYYKKGTENHERSKTREFRWLKKQVDIRGSDYAAYRFENFPQKYFNQIDTVLFFRALQGPNLIEKNSKALLKVLQEVHGLLKPDGIVGVVQHKAPENLSDEWANGENGYLKESLIKKVFKESGFVLVDQSEILLNPKDTPSEKDNVWRLPPALSNSKDNPKLRAEMKAIGESSRMVLKFKKK